MPLIEAVRPLGSSTGPGTPPVRRQSQHSEIAKTAIMSNIAAALEEPSLPPQNTLPLLAEPQRDSALMPPPKTVANRAIGKDVPTRNLPVPAGTRDGVGGALTDTPVSTAPNSPQVSVGTIFALTVHKLIGTVCPSKLPVPLLPKSVPQPLTSPASQSRECRQTDE